MIDELSQAAPNNLSPVQANFVHCESTRYAPSRLIGLGSSGLVFSAVDQVLGESVAIKKVAIQSRAAARNMLREIRVQKMLDHANVLGLHDLLLSRAGDIVYQVMPRMETDLGRILRSAQVVSTYLSTYQ